MNEPLHRFISAARWFGGKGREFEITDVRSLPVNPGAEAPPYVFIELVTLAYRDGAGDDDAAAEVYQLPVSYYPWARHDLEHALIGQWSKDGLGDVFGYDATHDHDAMPHWLRAFAEGRTTPDLVFHRLAGHELDLTARSALYGGEQSNSTVFFGEDSLLKVFRKITAGPNPDIEVHEALTRAGSDHVAALYGWLEAIGPEGGEATQLAMLQQFLRTGSDGWELALASVRDLYAEGDLHAHEVGGDFAGESHRLGVATAEVHDALAIEFPSGSWSRAELGNLADEMTRRLAAVVPVVPELADYADRLRAAFDAVRSIDTPVVVQRIHGDLHLGQTLRTVKGWKLVDFEGEPAKSLAERLRPDSAWRDVAGMLRSFDYAAHAVEADIEAPAQAIGQVATRAQQWAERNRSAFMDGYTSVRGAGDQTLLRAYEVDKAVYETLYEARNRPDWLQIPMSAIRRLAR